LWNEGLYAMLTAKPPDRHINVGHGACMLSAVVALL